MPSYARIDVPVSHNAAVGSGSYLRLGTYAPKPDEDIVKALAAIKSQKSTVTVTQLTEAQVEEYAATNNKQTNYSQLLDLSTAEYARSKDGVMLKTDKALYVDVADAVVRRVGYETTNVITGDHVIDVDNGIHHVHATQGVKIASEQGNIDIDAKGYVNIKSRGNTTEWTYGDKTSKVKGKQISYTDGEKKDYIKGYQYSENDGTKESYVKGSNKSTVDGDSTSTVNGAAISFVFGNESAIKGSGKTELIMGAAISLNIAISMKIILGAEIKVAFPTDIKLAVSDFKMCHSNITICNVDTKISLVRAKPGVIEGKWRTFLSGLTGITLEQGAAKVANKGAEVKNNGATVLP